MKVNLEYDNTLSEDEIVLKVSSENKRVKSLMIALKEENTNSVVGKLDEKIYLIDLSNVECFFTYGNEVLFLANGIEYKVGQKLYELQYKFESKNFIRISKSTIINIKKVEYLAPAFNKKLIFKLDSGREEYSSRSYYSEIKNKLGV